jgi:hypothetical protein
LTMIMGQQKNFRPERSGQLSTMISHTVQYD